MDIVEIFVLSAIFGVVAQKEHGNRWVSIFAPVAFLALWIPFSGFIGLSEEIVGFASWLTELLNRGWIAMTGGYVGAMFAITVLNAPQDDW